MSVYRSCNTIMDWALRGYLSLAIETFAFVVHPAVGSYHSHLTSYYFLNLTADLYLLNLHCIILYCCRSNVIVLGLLLERREASCSFSASTL